MRIAGSHRRLSIVLSLAAASVAGGALFAADAPASPHAGCPMMAAGAGSSMAPGAGAMAGVPMPAGAALTEPGEAAFAALAEAASRLESDPETDWSHANLLALREHLVDMSEVFLRASVVETPAPDGVVARVTGQGRTLEAIRRMVKMHAMHAADVPWSAAVTDLPDGVELRITSADPREVERIRALGFFGYLTMGDHHKMHHWMLARGGTMGH